DICDDSTFGALPPQESWRIQESRRLRVVCLHDEGQKKIVQPSYPQRLEQRCCCPLILLVNNPCEVFSSGLPLQGEVLSLDERLRQATNVFKVWPSFVPIRVSN